MERKLTRKTGGMNLHFCTHSIFNSKPRPLLFFLFRNTVFEGLYIPAGSNMSIFWCKGLERKKKVGDEVREKGMRGWWRGKGRGSRADGGWAVCACFTFLSRYQLWLLHNCSFSRRKEEKKLQRVSAQHSDASSAGRKFKGARTAALICHAAIFGPIC